MKTVQQWSLLFAGALAGVIGSFLFTQHERWLSVHNGLFYATILLIGLLIVGAFPFRRIGDGFLRWRSKKKPYAIGILSDIGWDEKRPYRQFATGTQVTIKEWREQLMEDAERNGVKIEISLVSSKDRFYRYSAILNPYGGVYPEEDLASATVLSKIFDYVGKGGTFVNVADVPGFYAYSPKLERKSVAGAPILTVREDSGRLSVSSISPVALAPFVQKLWLNVNPHEKEERISWKSPVKNGTERFGQDIRTMRIERIAVVERNVEPVLTLADAKGAGESELTPLFFATYENGKFLISLVYQDSDANINNQKTKEILSVVLLQAIKGR